MVTWRFWYLIGLFIPTFGFPILARGTPKKEIEQVNWLFLPTLFKRFLYIYSYEDDNSLFKSWPSYALSLPCVSCFCSFLCGQSLSYNRLEISNIDLQLIIDKSITINLTGPWRLRFPAIIRMYTKKYCRSTVRTIQIQIQIQIQREIADCRTTVRTSITVRTPVSPSAPSSHS